MNDPFASAPDEAQTETITPEPDDSTFDEPPAEAPRKTAAKKAAPKKAVAKKAADEDEDAGDFHPFTLSLKAHGGFDAPLLVLRGKTIPELADLLEGEGAVELGRLMQNASRASGYFAKQFPDKQGGPAPKANGGGDNSGGAQEKPAYQQAPGGEKRYCAHGEMAFKSDVSKAGKPYKGFFCPSTDRNDQCKAQFLK
ncbi:hypothetical protein [Nocardia abscessus]|uniref:hypothetical protein n=1 Tax=Nocardia abscessus TaxID=120957 RepID=UPI0024558297|nr:hypothetical protein [Nocardia abscessus]